MKGGREKPKKEREGERRRHGEQGRERKRKRMRAVKREGEREGNLGELFNRKKWCSREKTKGWQTWF